MKDTVNKKTLRVKKYFMPCICFYLSLFPLSLLSSKKSIVIKSPTIYTVTRGIIENGAITIENGNIKDVGIDIPFPENSIVIHLKEGSIIPGIIDAGTTIGIENSDLTEILVPVTPHLKIIDSYNPFGKTGYSSPYFQEAIRGGITTVFLYPGNNVNVISGLGALVKLAGKSIKDMTIKEAAAMVMNMGELPIQAFKAMKRMPTTRMDLMSLLREAFEQAEMAKKQSKNISPEHEAILKTLNGEIPVRIHANKLRDIIAAVRFGNEYGLRIIIDHGIEAFQAADRLAENNIPVVLQNNFLPTSIFTETKGFREEYARILSNKGIKIAFQSDSVVGGKILKFSRINAIIYVSYGLDKEEALKGLTLYPAQMFGVSDRIGSLEPGKDADLVILDGDPFDALTNVIAVMINGSFIYKKFESNHFINQ